MTHPAERVEAPGGSRLRCGIVLHVGEDVCEIAPGTGTERVRYASGFPSPRSERVSPGHLVAGATAPDGAGVVVWRWYDAVVLGERDDLVRLWEPAHGEITAARRGVHRSAPPGSRAYLSAGLPGAQWWVAGPVVSEPAAAEVELDEVERLYTEHGLWDEL